MVSHIKFYFSILICLFAVSLLSADTIPGGNVSGTWYQANSPYYITGYITIPAGDTLVIEPGVEVYFMSNYIFTVNGFLEAVGTASDSIHFAPDTSAAAWLGLWFDNAPDNSHLDYCSISGVGGLLGSHIHLENYSNPVITHCRINANAGTVFASVWVMTGSNPSISDCLITGGVNGIRWEGYPSSSGTISGCTISNCTESAVLKVHGHLTMIDCTISDNLSYSECGAGIRSLNEYITLINCSITDNTSYGAGGGIYCQFGSHTISNCTFSGNKALNSLGPYIGGGGICFDNANGSLSHCIFCGNEAWEGGGGITINGTTRNLTIDHCTIDGNDAGGDGGSGMWLRGSPTTDVANSIISYNTGDYGIRNEGTLTVDYTDFYGNDSGAIAGNVPSGFGVLDTINYNSDSCDVYFNIFMDPMFVDTANGDYHLTAGSPCIDAGDPAFAYDPDSTITDMGAYWYDQGMPEINIPLSLLDFGTVTVGDSSSLPLTIHNIGNADLILYNVTNNLSVFTNDWNPADSLILPGDSLEVTVTFTPDDTVTFTDTLWIDNNDTLAYVELTGVGEPPSGIAEDIPPLGAPALKVCGSNLFSNSITFRISGVAKSKEPIKLQIFDVAGRRVKQISLLPFNLSVGAQATWDAKGIAPGIYFVGINGSVKQKVVKIR